MKLKKRVTINFSPYSNLKRIGAMTYMENIMVSAERDLIPVSGLHDNQHLGRVCRF